MQNAGRFYGAVLAISAASVVAAEETNPRAAKITQLETRLAQLEAQQAQNSKDLAATIDSVLRDAQRRSNLLCSDSASAGYDDGFFIRSGDFEFRPTVAFVFQNITSFVDRGPTDTPNDGFQNGFQVERIELEFEGTILSPQLAYDVVIKTPRDGDPFLDEAWVVYSFAQTPYAIKAGQFKDDVSHEETVSFKRQLAAQRSLANEVLAGSQFDRVQGVALLYGADDKPLRASIAAHDGAASFNTPFTDSPSDSAFLEYFGFSSRVEWKLAGDWKDYKDFSARDTRNDLLVLGAAADWTQGQFADASSTDVGGDRFFPTADIQYELAGPKIGLYGAFYGDYTTFRDADDDRFNYGAVAQVGYALTHQWEIFARYDFIQLDRDFLSENSEDLFQEITTGVNYFLGNEGSFGHRAKITVDVGYLPNGSPIRATSFGIPQASDNDMFYLRAQLILII